jgi:hypothetical protein
MMKKGWTLVDKKTGKLIEGIGINHQFYLWPHKKIAKYWTAPNEKLVRAKLIWEDK